MIVEEYLRNPGAFGVCRRGPGTRLQVEAAAAAPARKQEKPSKAFGREVSPINLCHTISYYIIFYSILLHYIVFYCILFYCVIFYGITLYYTKLYCSILVCVILHDTI